MRRYLYVVFVVCFLCEAVGQTPKIAAFDRLKTQAELHFREGSYLKAINLYKACLNYPYLENPQALQSALAKAQQIVQLDDQAMAEVRRGNKQKALALIEQILKVNPSDPYAKASRQDLRAALNYTPTSQNQRLKKRAQEYIDQGQWEKTANILRVIDVQPNGKKDPEVARNRIMVNELMAVEREIAQANQVGNWRRSTALAVQTKNKYPEAIHSPTIQTAVARKDSPNTPSPVCSQVLQDVAREMANCNFSKAEAALVNARKAHIECQTDVRLSRKLTLVRTIQQEFTKLNELGVETTKRAAVIQIYERLMKQTFRCVQERYFDFVYQEGIGHKNNGNCAPAIIAFQRAKRINPTAAKRLGLTEDIAGQTEICNCLDKGKVLASELQRADKLYGTCECDSAIAVWQSAATYLCASNSTGKTSWEAWRAKTADCEKGGATVKLFTAMITEANQLLESNSCQEAKKRYQQADSLRVRCGNLNKQTIASALAQCTKCVQKQLFDSTIVKAEHSKTANFLQDALSHYEKALTHDPPADQIAGLNEVIAKLNCQVKNIGCPPADPIPPKPVTHLSKLALIAGGNRLFPTLLSTKYPVKNVAGGYGYTAGFRFDYISLKSPLSGYANVLYTFLPMNTINEDGSTIDEQFKLSYTEIGLGIKLHSPNKKEGGPRLYLHGGYSLFFPVAYKYSNFLLKIEDRASNTLNGAVKAPKGGVGIEWQQKRFGLSIEGYYGSFRDDLFNSIQNSQTINQRSFTSPANRVVGINSIFRFW